MKFRQIIPIVFILGALLLQACAAASSEGAIQTGIAQTLQISDLQTQAAAANLPADTATPPPAEAASATPVVDTATPPPIVSVSENTNCRRGPSTFYDQVTILYAGEEAEVIKTYDGDHNYVVIQIPDNNADCWLWLRYADPTDFSAYGLPKATLPPTPLPTATATPVSYWPGSWNFRVYHGGVERTGTISCNVSGSTLTCSGVGNPGAFSYVFSGSIAANKLSASGTYSGTGSGNWAAEIKSGNTNQFVGNLDMGSWEFCGWRSGSSMPAPCQWP
ncbi:MAG: hypothetical protein KIT46_07890 [Anaerolineales bacterium]|nr:hypothetical protein [Anaerolineales bacterium]MCW5855951.1 hypothetical protein [Anaerolineales bacterium]